MTIWIDVSVHIDSIIGQSAANEDMAGALEREK